MTGFPHRRSYGITREQFQQSEWELPAARQPDDPGDPWPAPLPINRRMSVSPVYLLLGLIAWGIAGWIYVIWLGLYGQ
jgi:hypothetical protein